MDAVDLVVVGCGWNGVAMAKTVYPGLNTNNILGSYEFSDFPMDPSLVGSRQRAHIPGEGVHRYFCEAVQYFDLERFLLLQTKVETATLRDDNLWQLSCSSTLSPGSQSSLLARKLVIATGLTSEPYMPTFQGQDSFQGLRIHSKELKPRADDLSKCQNVVVIGGNKSAWDVCYSVARRGGKAHMVMRPSGGGPSWVWPRRLKWFGWQTSLPRLTMIRMFTLFDPWPFAEKGTIWSKVRDFLHQSTLGLAITNAFWKLLGRHICRINGYREHIGTEKLEPWASTYWMGNSLSTLNYPSDWFELAKSGNIRIHHADVASLSGNSVKLTDRLVENVDALVCCTGWSALPPIDFLPSEARELLGIPQSELESESLLAREAQNWILDKRPYLRNTSRVVQDTVAGEKPSSKERTTPYRLYRYVVPSSERLLGARNLAFVGIDFSLQTVVLAQAQALWITAFFKDRLPHMRGSALDHKQILHDTILQSEYQELRRPKIAGGAGEKFPDLVFDSIPYVDILLGDLGLEAKRKGNNFRDLMTPYTLKHYRGLVQDWLRTVEK
ncbi:hypothetical protein M409DRAFT_69447 [Zasmidium cellare ATCC 36951]|uniref:L-ornithine N(5)-oxygenase n=1 Tax=Zasmidium cellare ATCC 36951 TaxID=1080233 RepID=A0A6A6C477_ZASCE|nr:uncharacterized protein M409DRAFT_69447 [Zasmidium cellare ATCC 36951]KAF2161924.1 hypothetical protein M409DRAFT_69447 [Zasmidium cellare ATCC 36951]